MMLPDKYGYVRLDSKTVYLLINNPEGIKYKHQYAGVGCYHINLQGDLINLGVSDSYVFNPSWWYNSIYRCDDRTGGKFLYKGKVNWPYFTSYSDGIWNQIEEQIQQDEENKVYYPQIIRQIQEEINRLNTRFYKIQINLPEIYNLTEALVPVKIWETKEQYDDLLTWDGIKSGYILWVNCD